MVSMILWALGGWTRTLKLWRIIKSSIKGLNQSLVMLPELGGTNNDFG